MFSNFMSIYSKYIDFSILYRQQLLIKCVILRFYQQVYCPDYILKSKKIKTSINFTLIIKSITRLSLLLNLQQNRNRNVKLFTVLIQQRQHFPFLANKSYFNYGLVDKHLSVCILFTYITCLQIIGFKEFVST